MTSQSNIQRTMKPARTLYSTLFAIFAAVLAFAGQSFAASGTWVPTTGTNSWNVNGNWTGATFPNGAGQTANLNIDLTGNTIINLNAATTVGILNIGDTTTGFFTTTIQTGTGTNSLIFDNSGAGSQLNRNTGTGTTATAKTDTISAGVTLNDNLTITNNYGDRSNPLQISGKITGTGKITIAGGGNTYLSNTANDYSGGLTLNAGGSIQTGSNGAVFGTGTLTINGGNIDTSFTSAASQALTTSNANVWNAAWTQNAIVSSPTWTNNGTVLLGANISLSLGQRLNLTNVVSDAGANRNLTWGSTGTALTLGGANTFGGGLTLSSTGTVRINNSGSGGTSSALGTGTFTISGAGTIDNTSAGLVTISTNNVLALNANFTYTGGSQSLNLGTGNITLGATRTITVSGNTLTLGGAIGASAF